LSEADFETLAQAAIRAASLSINSDEEARLLDECKSTDKLTVKNLYSALVNLALEAAKMNALEGDLAGILDRRLSKEFQQIFLKHFEANVEAIRAQLARISSSGLSRVVEIDWRLDYYVQNNILEHIRRPVYFISLTTQEPDGSLKKVEFQASLEELQDLLGSLKDAANAVKLVKQE